jgi:hypothetical protein
MTDAFLMDMVYVGCGVIFGLIVRKLVVTYCKRPWVGLTDEELAACIQMGESGSLDGFVKPLATYRAIEAKLKEKNT